MLIVRICIVDSRAQTYEFKRKLQRYITFIYNFLRCLEITSRYHYAAKFILVSDLWMTQFETKYHRQIRECQKVSSFIRWTRRMDNNRMRVAGIYNRILATSCLIVIRQPSVCLYLMNTSIYYTTCCNKCGGVYEDNLRRRFNCIHLESRFVITRVSLAFRSVSDTSGERRIASRTMIN